MEVPDDKEFTGLLEVCGGFCSFSFFEGMKNFLRVTGLVTAFCRDFASTGVNASTLTL